MSKCRSSILEKGKCVSELSSRADFESNLQILEIVFYATRERRKYFQEGEVCCPTCIGIQFLSVASLLFKGKGVWS